MRLTYLDVLKAIYKHKCLSINQMSYLFDKHFSTITQHIYRMKNNGLLKILRTPIGVYYFITSEGAKLLGFQRAYRVKAVESDHTFTELIVLRHLLDNKKIKAESYKEFLDSYETDREIKRRKFSELGGSAHKLRYVDLLIKTKEGLIAYEIEITKKNPTRYKSIIKKLDRQFKSDNWDKIVWVVKKNTFRWFTNKIQKENPESTTSIIIDEKFKKELTQKQKERYGW